MKEKMRLRKEDCRERYLRWWLGKEVRFNAGDPFKKVIRIHLVGPEHFAWGRVMFLFEDGTVRYVPTMAMRPRKWDVQVKEN